MRRFRFRLAAIERVARARYEALRRDLGDESRRVRHAEQQAVRARRHAGALMQSVVEEGRRGVAAAEFVLATGLARRLQAEAGAWETSRRQAEERRDELAGRLRDTWKRLDALGRARMRARRAWRRDLVRIEQHESDERRPSMTRSVVVPPRRKTDAHE